LRVGSGDQSQDARSGRARWSAPDCQSGQPRFCRTAARCSPRCRQHHPSLNTVTGESIDPLLLETTGDPLAAYAGTGARISFVPVSPAIPLAPSKPTGRARPWPASSAGGSQPCRATIFRKPQAPRYRLTPDSFKVVRDRTFSLHPRYKMPEQPYRFGTDRAALVQFLERPTKR